MILGVDVKAAWVMAINAVGEDVTFLPRAGGSHGPFRASVQTPAQAGLVGEFDQETFVVFFDPDAIPTEPLRFDRMMVRGASRAVQWAHREGTAPPDFLWKVLVIGK